MLLTSASILSADDLNRETVSVPEWGGDVLVRGMTAEEHAEYEASLMHVETDIRGGVKLKPNLHNARAKLVVKCLIDENGKRLFTDADAKKLGEKSIKAILRIAKVIERLSGIGKGEQALLGKALDETTAQDSTSD